jgi:enoyl-CoA hydratase
MTEYNFLRCESVGSGHILRITLNRPEARNAQNRGLLVELDHALLKAEADDDIRVIILAGAGPLFSSGHDMGSSQHRLETLPGPDRHPSRDIHGGTRPGTEGRMLQEWHYYFQNTRRWRDLRKITIAQVHGKVYAAGLMLMWACDLIVASESTTFADVVGARLGMCGVEYFAHPWELGPRRAKELLLTGDSLDVEEAHQIGMVSKVFSEADFEERTIEFAQRIAEMPSMPALLIKEAVNQSVDNMGFQNALNASFSLHQLNHAHWAELSKGESWVGTSDQHLPVGGASYSVRPRDKEQA